MSTEQNANVSMTPWAQQRNTSTESFQCCSSNSESILLFDLSIAGIRYDPTVSQEPKQLCKFDLTEIDSRNQVKLIICTLMTLMKYNNGEHMNGHALRIN